MKDLFFEQNYGKLYEKIEKGKCEIFNFQNSLGHIRNLFIKREVPFQLDQEKFFDLVTPYGYGGPLIVQCENGKKTELIAAYKNAFQQYCEENNIISEFVRFHPIADNAHDFIDCYDMAYMRKTVGANLKEFDDPFSQEFSKTTRKNIRKALRDGVHYKATLNPENLKAFKEIYYSTMERNKADSFYYFDDQYFEDCLNYFGENILLIEVIFEGHVIGVGFNFVYGNLVHTHLSGTLEEFNLLSPASVLQYALVLWGKENGSELIHFGGGRSNSLEDPLYQFKKQFGKNTSFDFYIGKKVWMAEKYAQLCRAAGVGEEEEFFPAYRSKKIVKSIY